MSAFAADHFHTLHSKRTRLATILLVFLVILAGCGAESGDNDGDDGRRFVNEPGSTKTSTEPAASTPVINSPTPRPQSTVPPEDALSLRGAPHFIYLELNGDLQVYDTITREFRVVNIPDHMTIIDFASSPTGDRVGVLGTVSESVVVQFYGADGEPLGGPNVLPYLQVPGAASPIASPAATPTSSQIQRKISISWVPQGNSVVVSGPGVLQRISMSGVIMPLSRAGVTGSVLEALWSPMDSQLAILTELGEGHQGVFVLDSGTAEARELEVLHLQPEQGLSNLQWLPNGLGLLVVAGNNNNGEVMNGQIYVYQFDNDVPKLVATSGQGGPAATISHAVVSPDGHAVAYAVVVRDGDRWVLHSLWVKPIKGGPALSIPVESSSPITSIHWTAEGLVWQQENGTVTVIDKSLQPRPLGEAPVGTPAASPGASPVSEATPVG